VTFALRTAAPLVSVTVPSIVPRNVCAEAGVALTAVNMRSAAQEQTLNVKTTHLPHGNFSEI
jgi:hypothetical protein